MEQMKQKNQINVDKTNNGQSNISQANVKFSLLKRILGSYIVLASLSAIILSSWGIKKYYLEEKFERLNSIKVSYIMERQNAMSEIKPIKIIECLIAFARFSNTESWIDQIEYDRGIFDLIIHTNSIAAVNSYISNVQEFAELSVISKEINKASFLKTNQKQKEKAQKQKIPFAARKFLEYKKKKVNNTQDQEESKNKVTHEKIADYKFSASVQFSI